MNEQRWTESIVEERFVEAADVMLMLNAVTPFITPDLPWLANLPLVVAIMAFLLAFGLSHMRAERARAPKGRMGRGWHCPTFGIATGPRDDISA